MAQSAGEVLDRKRLVRWVLERVASESGLTVAVGPDQRLSTLLGDQPESITTDVIVTSLDLRARIIVAPLGRVVSGTAEIRQLCTDLLSRNPDTAACVWVLREDDCLVVRPDSVSSAWRSSAKPRVDEEAPQTLSQALAAIFGDLAPSWTPVTPVNWTYPGDDWWAERASRLVDVLATRRHRVPELRQACDSLATHEFAEWVTSLVRRLLVDGDVDAHSEIQSLLSGKS
jgi:hypothetical protein